MELPARLRRAYRLTAYAAGGVTVRVGRRSPEMDRLLARLGVRAGGFVGAGNPLSRRMPPAWNRRRHEVLRQVARRLPSVEGEGVASGWSEAHLFLAADTRRVLALARRFRQRAVVTVARGCPARLQVLGYAPMMPG